MLSAPFGSGDGLVHDRGAVLVHGMLMLAGGGEACTDVEFLRSQPELFGRMASDSTLYRTMRSIDSETAAGLGKGMATVRGRVWDGFPKSRVVVLDIDSSMHEVNRPSSLHTTTQPTPTQHAQNTNPNRQTTPTIPPGQPQPPPAPPRTPNTNTPQTNGAPPSMSESGLVVCLQNDWACPASRRRSSLRSASSTYAPGTPSSAGLARNAAAVACHPINSQTDH